MRVRATISLGWLFGSLSILTAASPPPLGQTAPGCASYVTGLQLMEKREFDKARIQFESAKNSCAITDIKAESELREGETHLFDQPPNYAAVDQFAQAVIVKYPQSSAVAGAKILQGRVWLAEHRSGPDIDRALQYYATAESTARPGIGGEGLLRIAEAAYYSGIALLSKHDEQRALESFQRAAAEYPDSIWAARALLGVATCYARRGEPLLALEALQQVRRRLGRFTEEAETALSWSTILFRLHVRPQDVLRYTGALDGDESKLGKGVGLVADARGRVVVAHVSGWSVFTGAAEQPFPCNKRAEDCPTAVGETAGGTIAIAKFGTVSVYVDEGGPERGGAFTPKVPSGRAPAKPVDARAVVPSWNGSWLLADGESKAIQRFSTKFTYESPFAAFDALRLATNHMDDVAALDNGRRTIRVFDRDGANPRDVVSGGTTKLIKPLDIAFDGLDNLYVLDEGAGAVHVFDASLKPIRSMRAPVDGDGMFKDVVALAVDEAGRIIVFDNGGKRRVRVYQ